LNNETLSTRAGTLSGRDPPRQKSRAYHKRDIIQTETESH